MKRTVEIEDSLDALVDSAIDDVKAELMSYLEHNPDTDETPCISNDLDDSGAIHEIVDGAVPSYTGEITDLFYLYGNEFEQAFDDAGIGSKDDDGWPMGWKAAAIYCYIDQKVHEWYSNNADDLFDEWKEKRDSVKSYNRLSEPCADCGAMPNTEHDDDCEGGNHSLESQASD